VTDTDTSPAVAQEPPQVEGAGPAQRSTGGDLSRGRPEARPITRLSAQDVLRQAYGRQAELQEQAQGAPRGAPREAPREAPEPPREAPAQPQREGPRERGPDGRFLPQAQPRDQVDGAPAPAVQETPTPAPTAPTPQRPPARPKAAAPEAASRVAAPDAPASSAPAPRQPAEPVPDEPTAPQTEAPREEFRSEEWQRALQAQPGLRRAVRGIQGDPNLSPTQKAERLSTKLTEGLRLADAEALRAQQMTWLRDNRPTEFIEQLRADEEAQRQARDLELRISHMIAEAYEVDPTDPDYLEAGAREGEDYTTGLSRFVDYTSQKSPVFKRRLEEALAVQAKAHQTELEGLRAQHKLDLEAARERGRSEGRSPYGRNGTAAPRTQGNGVRPVGQDDGPDGGPQVPRKAPDIATYRGAIALGYQQREPT